MSLRNFGEKTQKDYIRAIQEFHDLRPHSASPMGRACACSEVAALKVSDIDSERMMLRVEQGKGRKDRYAMLSPVLLELLRDWWRIAHPKAWLCTGQESSMDFTDSGASSHQLTYHLPP